MKKTIRNNKENSCLTPCKGRKKILIIGSGPYAIGSSVEFDWCGVQVLRTLKALGHETIFVNSNPETVSTDFDECDKLYFEELTVERIRDICDHESPDGVIFSTGGQVSQNIAMKLAKYNIPLLGTNIKSIDMCEDREKFSKLCDELEIVQPQWASLNTMSEAIKFAKKVKFPVLVRPSFVLSGAAMAVAINEANLQNFLQIAVGKTDASVVISKFEKNSKEIEFEGVAQNGKIICSAIAEHVENAGVHSGDATIVLPPQNLYLETVRRVRDIAIKLAKKLKISGPFNIQFLAKQNDIKIIECNLRASRTLPFTSKVLGQNFIDIATKIWMGEQFDPCEKNLLQIQKVGVKSPQFSFSRLKGADPMLGVEMSSTGEVACFGKTVEEAFLKSLLSSGFTIPAENSRILVTLGAMKDKVEFLESAKKFTSLGFKFVGTAGTANFLNDNNIPCDLVHKISSKLHPNVTDEISRENISLVINTQNNFSHEEITDGYLIRRSTIDKNIPLVINLQIAKLLAKSLAKFPKAKMLPIN